jgi:anaerobic ribonucleoside-triphosphate reductase activating protein
MQHSSNMLVPVVDWGITFNEVPDKVAVYFELGDCNKHCKGCHSPELWEPMEGAPLDVFAKIAAMAVDKGANAICVLGGTDCNSFSRDTLVFFLRVLAKTAPVCLYAGSDDIKAMQELAEQGECTWLKTGSYKEELGGLQSPTTNQRFFKREQRQHIDYRNREYSVETYWLDITEYFWNKG